MNNLITRILVFLAVLVPFWGGAQFYIGSNQEFGKNRVQYRDFNWLYYPDKNFEVYFYQGGKELAEYALQSARKQLPEIEAQMDYPLEDVVQIVVYNKQSEFRQSNVGIQDETQYNIGGQTRIIGSKMFLYYEGSHQQLDEQIRGNLTRVLFSQMMFGGDWKNVIKNSTLLTIPNWYEEGLISFMSNPWTPEAESRIKSGFETGKFDHFNRLEGVSAQYAGHAVWKYISDVYGPAVIPNILYMTRVSRNIESGFLFVLGVSLETITTDVKEYYLNQFRRAQASSALPDFELLEGKPKTSNAIGDATPRSTMEQLGEKGEKQLKKLSRILGELPVKYKKRYEYSQFKLSPDGEHIAFVTNEMGQYKVWLYSFATGKLKKIYKREYRLERIVDKSFPILAWHPSSQLLTFTFERRGRAFLANYNLEDKKVTEKELFRIEKVVDMSYAADGRRMVFSGVNQGQSDLYLYQVIGNNQQQLTNDIYDDLHPEFIGKTDKIIFASNRPDDTLRLNPPLLPVSNLRDIYIFSVGNNFLLERVTNTPQIDETHPSGYDDLNYTYLANAGGIYNRQLARIDSTISHIDTTIHYRYFTVSEPLSKFPQSPWEYDFNPASGNYGLVFYDQGRYQYYKGNRSTDQVLNEEGRPTGIGTESGGTSTEILEIPSNSKQGEVDIDNYLFRGEEKDYEFEKETISLGEGTVTIGAAKPDSAQVQDLPKSRNYRLNFATDYVLSQVTNAFANQFYQTYTGPGSAVPGLSGMIKLGASDLFEDYKVVGGFRLSGSLENSDYGLSFENLKGRLDKRITFQRQGNRQINQFTIQQIHAHQINYQLKYPFTELLAIRGTLTYRNERIVALSTDPLNLARKNQYINNVGGKLELIFDNTINKGLNLYNGTRYKLWAEYYQEPTVKKSNFSVVGLDIRHYQRIHRDLIAAFRIAGSTSLGNRKLVYYLGGVDNWVFPRTNYDTEISETQNYYYQSIGTPLRGFYINSRNGNSFAVANAELRWPIVKYFMKNPIKSDFLQNFQIITFGDVGAAWTGAHPYAEDNEFNSQIVQSGPITVTIENNREPVIYGYGFGLRSRLLGYFVRLDWSWGVDDGIVLPRVLHFSLSMDF
ncbi:MAG: hypothetical protein KDC12_04715 [Flavobacteriales bacterium]|nr:hypothetical protein [Flavobacteriales bacterium]